ncbi:hypothetical protein LF65_02266 [Clostridium beijerinckii]|uniref:J domain-containing protein n=1 Tax=Clostridium beijerinckii TaxID=1520 RepID=A0A0B5QLI7_CLOBE|nr:J domain-containing protein [Clostridium beijerinckii]AJG98852.1 hypothetical protein LF65_02266 [Clostridium beijerinckii]
MNYYEILGVDKNADSDQIKKAYRQLVKKYHPDVNNATNANTFFNLIQEAYRVLNDEKLKMDYDNRNNYVHKESTNKTDNYNDKSKYGFGEESSEEEAIRQQEGKRSIFVKILIVLLKILLALFVPIISFCEYVSTVGAGIVALISKVIMFVFLACTIMGIVEVYKGEVGGWLTLIMSIVVAFVAFCFPYIIIMVPVALGLLKEKIRSFVFNI